MVDAPDPDRHDEAQGDSEDDASQSANVIDFVEARKRKIFFGLFTAAQRLAEWDRAGEGTRISKLGPHALATKTRGAVAVGLTWKQPMQSRPGAEHVQKVVLELLESGEVTGSVSAFVQEATTSGRKGTRKVTNTVEKTLDVDMALKLEEEITKEEEDWRESQRKLQTPPTGLQYLAPPAEASSIEKPSHLRLVPPRNP